MRSTKTFYYENFNIFIINTQAISNERERGKERQTDIHKDRKRNKEEKERMTYFNVHI